MKISDYFYERYPIQSWIEFFKQKSVPIHKHSIWYYTGGFALFLIMVQIVTGILLLLYYRPTAEAAFESVQFIMTKVKFGWLIRSLHSWSANLLMGAIFIHMFATYFLKSYRRPREFTWISGTLLLLICIGFGFSGYLLPWNELALTATRVGTEITSLVPFVGKYLMIFLRGGDQVTGATLTRFFGIHVAVLPLALGIMLGLHLLFVQLQGMSLPFSIEKSGKEIKEKKFFPHFVLHDILGWLVTLGILLALCSIFPWELGSKADIFAPTPAGVHPEWYLIFTYATLKLAPAKMLFFEGESLVIMGFLVGLLFWIAVPFLDRKSQQGIPSKIFTLTGLLIVLYIAIMTIVAYLI